ncbi:MAG: DNA-binding protein [Desulfurococcaceae archaeon]|jgi:predicted transcriptional regulator
MKTVLISIKPKYAEQILNGVKSHELRAGSVFSRGDRIIMYASNPVRAVVGEFTAGFVMTGSYEEVVAYLKTVGYKGLSSEDFEYIRGKRTRVSAIEVVDPIRYPEPISLATLKRVGLERPPRSYMVLNPSIKLHAKLIELFNKALTTRSRGL